MSSGRCFSTLSAPKRRDQRQAARLVFRIEDVDQPDQFVGLERRAAFEADRVLDAAAEFDMGVIGLAGAVADPQHVAGGGVPVAAGRIDAGQRLLVAQQQGLVAGEEIGRAQLRRGIGIDAAGAHEAHRLGDAVGECLIALEGGRILEETKRPFVDMLEIGIAALREGAQQIEGRRRLPVGHDLALRIGLAALKRRCRIIDDVAAIDRQFHAIDRLGGRRARLGELAGNAADLHHRLAAGKGQDHRHLQEDAEEIADIVGGMFGEAFGAIAALEQESPCLRRPGPACASACAPRRQKPAAESRPSCFSTIGQACLVVIVRHLHDREFPPAVRCPVGRHCVVTPNTKEWAYTPVRRYSSYAGGPTTLIPLFH